VTGSASTLVCSGCGWMPDGEDPYPFRCANAGLDDGDHVVARVLDVRQVSWPEGEEENPFLKYRRLAHSYQVAIARGMSDADYVDLVERLDKEVAAVDGRGFAQTPFGRAPELNGLLGFEPGGGVWVKDETGNVSGSHKARHLMGLMIYLQVAEGTGLVQDGDRSDLAIASCGNAALAAAVVARATGRRLRVFVPTWADVAVLDRLRSLGAVIEVCDREPDVPGDPAYHALQLAIASGTIPFTCQGNENGLAIEGGQTLGYEMVDALRGPGTTLDRMFVQVGGGALASAVMAAFSDARDLGAADRIPRLHAVQTLGGHPLKRAYDRVAERAAASSVDQALTYAASHRSEFMWPWEEEPRSIAHGILDDETYDWLAVVRGMMATGGHPVVVDEDLLERANGVGRTATQIDVDHTGTSGLAGFLAMRDRGEVGPEERVAVLFTGAGRETREGTKR
jgi:threonine synthase